MKKAVMIAVVLYLVLTLTACAAGVSTAAGVNSPAAQTSASLSGTTSGAESDGSSALSATQALAQNSQTHEDAADYRYDLESAVAINLQGDAISAEGSGVIISGNSATITTAGTYLLSGSLEDGQIIVNTPDKGTVQLILNGVDIHSASSAPIYIANAKKVVLILQDGTTNTLSDGAAYTFAVPAEEEPNAAVFSKADLTIFGGGSLTVKANFRDGINSKDGLVIASGSITVSAADDGIRGKDYLVIKNGSLNITTQGDGLKADNADDPALGYIAIAAGTVHVTAGGDAVAAKSDVLITGGTFEITAGGGSSAQIREDQSAKGIKGEASVNIEAGTFVISAADDALHSNGSITINDGIFQISTGDDGMHADETLTINGGEVTVNQSYEGLESAVINLNGGSVHLTASDDGINVGGGNDGSGMGQGMRPGRGAAQGQNGAGQDSFSYTGKYYLYVREGYIYVDANGDGVDVNGAVEMSGGVLLVNGPTEQMNGALDYDGGFKMTGGFLVAAGSAGMAMAPDSNSSQPAVLVYLTATQPAGTLFTIQNASAESFLAFAPTKAYQSVVFASPDLTSGETYTVNTGGSSSGSATDGLYQGGTTTGSAQQASFTVSSTITTIGNGGQMARPGRMP